MKPMLLTDVTSTPEVVERYIADPSWIMQQKFDGARVIARMSMTGPVEFLSRSGEPIKFAAAKLVLPALTDSLIEVMVASGYEALTLDGELIPETGVYHVFDVLEFARVAGTPVDLTEGYSLRYRLPYLLTLSRTELVDVAPTFKLEQGKREFWATIVAAGVEGAVSKHLDSVYVPGSRSTQWVKHKLVKAADVVVTSVQRTFKADGVTLSHGKAELAVPIDPNADPLPLVDRNGKRISRAEYDALGVTQQVRRGPWVNEGRDLLPVGNASLIGKELSIDVGSVVEVEYLYWTGDAMIQPRIVRHRDDKAPADCTLAQFPAYSRQRVS